ncbi:MAG: endonuclease III domain-containing protein [Butyricimonas faecihominis]
MDGDEKTAAVYSLPTPKELARASLEELLDLKLGYRAEYIHRLSQNAAAESGPEKAEIHGVRPSMKYLTGFYGIGKKVANCVCLLACTPIEAFPVDAWMKRFCCGGISVEKNTAALPKTASTTPVWRTISGMRRLCRRAPAVQYLLRAADGHKISP